MHLLWGVTAGTHYAELIQHPVPLLAIKRQRPDKSSLHQSQEIDQGWLAGLECPGMENLTLQSCWIPTEEIS